MKMHFGSHLYWIECWPQKRYVHVLMSIWVKVTSFGKKRVFADVIKLSISRRDHPGL